MPICADASVGSPDGAVLHAALRVAAEKGLTRPGDRVVVSQCPRVTQLFGDTMREAGVVKILQLAADGISTVRAAACVDTAGHVVETREGEHN
ncbi:hypothetical protein MNEG_12113 [Monoraphidium neglectum]|uniref:Uncharacterized protein n=1 Tax=Monoraphidium neglectum TaxID=145388 RepID=A0A0D2KJ43_9CHLO|nr:hypothetical protein MNEG_12113 [Monoraphidium neglectum]KIY95848.1 hypothetical protein MNEG_12113 [Monoraphidium neglectum]|eukprot:XP_013894868.1 hypothetical protein MNEG_12113 [Monoraphidium neglectum]